MIVKVIGLGGIGSTLAEKVARFMNFSMQDQDPVLLLIDGDEYEPKNLERQEFTRYGNKAEAKCFELRQIFDKMTIDFSPEYVNAENVSEVVEEDNIILLAVDNHKTRKIISDEAATKDNVIVISGGNELTDGNVQRYVRKEGKDVTPKLTDYHPEIADPADKLPDEMSCEELSASEPQLLFTNLAVAATMCQMLHTTLNGDYTVSEVYFDIKTMNSVSHKRMPIEEGE